MQPSLQPHAGFFESNDAIPRNFSRMLRRLTAVEAGRPRTAQNKGVPPGEELFVELFEVSQLALKS